LDSSGTKRQVENDCGFNSKNGLMGEESGLAFATFEDRGAREEPNLVIRFQAGFINMRTPNIVLENEAGQVCEQPLRKRKFEGRS